MSVDFSGIKAHPRPAPEFWLACFPSWAIPDFDLAVPNGEVFLFMKTGPSGFGNCLNFGQPMSND